MRLDERQFELTAIAVFAAIAPHLARLPLWFALPCVLLIPLRILARRRGLSAPIWVRVPLAALVALAVLAHYGNIFGREPGSAFGVGLLALKLLETERVRDARVALSFAAFVLMSALLFTQTLAFTALVCAAVVVLLAALHALDAAPLDPSRRLRAGLRAGATLLAAAVPIAALAFAFVPRLGSPLWGAPGNDTLARSGLDDRMAPGTLSELLVDDSAAFRVAFDGAPPAQAERYFRGIVLWDFDGTTWVAGNWPHRLRQESVAATGRAVTYTVTLEPTDRHWLFALDVPTAAPDATTMTADRTLVADQTVGQMRQYRVESTLRYTLAPELTPRERAAALALPAGFDPQSRALAESWRRERGNDAGVISAALERFEASYVYTLAPPLLGRDSVDEFLFSTRQGFCEHYASAFTFLMRAAGIPARVVTGYQGGYWNDVGHYLLVRQSDAHAWSEVWLDGRGWVRVDPTAAVNPARVQRDARNAGDAGWLDSPFVRALRDRVDAVNRLWTTAIVQFNALRQRSLLTPFGLRDLDQSDLVFLLVGGLVAFMIAATIWAVCTATRREGDALDRAYERLCRRLARRGVARAPHEGPFDYRDRAARAWPAAAARLHELFATYATLRYALAEPPPERVRAFARAARDFRVGRVI